ncbi:MAG: hypothetical protein QM784_18240 [Polyangiaceae bacterium]
MIFDRECQREVAIASEAVERLIRGGQPADTEPFKEGLRIPEVVKDGYAAATLYECAE